MTIGRPSAISVGVRLRGRAMGGAGRYGRGCVMSLVRLTPGQARGEPAMRRSILWAPVLLVAMTGIALGSVADLLSRQGPVVGGAEPGLAACRSWAAQQPGATAARRPARPSARAGGRARGAAAGATAAAITGNDAGKGAAAGAVGGAAAQRGARRQDRTAGDGAAAAGQFHARSGSGRLHAGPGLYRPVRLANGRRPASALSRRRAPPPLSGSPSHTAAARDGRGQTSGLRHAPGPPWAPERVCPATAGAS